VIILLDLNYTLVANSRQKQKPFIKQIEHEQYRQWLIDLIRDQHVILVTARPEHYRQATLASIQAKTGWQPDEAYFNDLNLPPPALKQRLYLERIVPLHGDDPAAYLAIESNPRTHRIYDAVGVRWVKVREGEIWRSLP
jgi:hypothetical protein